MKKIVSKTGARSLSLSKISVRELTVVDLNGVAGGYTRSLSGCNQTGGGFNSCTGCQQ